MGSATRAIEANALLVNDFMAGHEVWQASHEVVGEIQDQILYKLASRSVIACLRLPEPHLKMRAILETTSKAPLSLVVRQIPMFAMPYPFFEGSQKWAHISQTGPSVVMEKASSGRSTVECASFPPCRFGYSSSYSSVMPFKMLMAEAPLTAD